MKRTCKTILLAAAGATLLCGVALAADIDLSTFDDDMMRTMDDTIKDLEPVIGAKNAKAALDDTAILRDNFKETEDWFAKNGHADDAVKIARHEQDLVAAVNHSLSAGDFEAAATTAREVSHTCKSCHDVYKPLTK
jgi:hypothetical protein